MNKQGVRDVLENKTTGISDVGYDAQTGGVTGVVNGKTYNFGKNGFTLGDDNRYRGTISSIRNNFKAATGYKGVNDALASRGRNVYFSPEEQKLYIDGVGFNTENMVNIDGILYAADDEISNLISSTEFKNPYSGMQAEVLDMLRNYRNFSYNPSNDKSLKLAQEEALRAIREDYGSRGLLSSSDAVLDGAIDSAELVAKYEDLAYRKYRDGKNDLFDMLESLMGLEETARKNYEMNVDKAAKAGDYYEKIRQNAYENKRKDEAAEFEKSLAMAELEQKINENNIKQGQNQKDDAWEQAYKRAKMTGVVSSYDAPILGLPAGTRVK